MARNSLIQVRRDTAANWTSVNPTLAAGEMGFETDTGKFKIGTGSTAWISLLYATDASDITGTFPSLTVTGDITVDSGTLKVDSTNNRVGIANASPAYTLDVNGTVEATQFIQGTDYLSPYQGFRNAIINGDFRINQRAFSSTTTNGTYGFDRWAIGYNSGTMTYSSQTFTVGSPAATGYESPTFARVVTASQTGTGHFALLNQKIEDVRTFANSTVTISFWAKASSGTPKVAIETEQSFGSGGSPSANVTTAFSAVTLSTSWARYSVTGTIPNINGKTIGTTANTSYTILNLWVSSGSSFDSRASSIGTQNNTFDFWGVQVERGSVATPFEQRPLQTELAMCQRYYFKITTETAGAAFCSGYFNTANLFYFCLNLPVQMRGTPNISINDIAADAVSGGGALATPVTKATPNTLAGYSGVATTGVASAAGIVQGSSTASFMVAEKEF